MTTTQVGKRVNIDWMVTWGLAALLALTLTACGGSGGGSGSGQPPGAPSSISDVSRGSIDDFGSIIMNGRKFETGEFTSVEGDDNPSLSDLNKGMEVEIRGGMDDNGNLTAGTVRVEAAVKGAVTQAMGAGLPLMVLGQTIDTTNAIVDNNIAGGLAALVAGDEVEIHGAVAPGGIIDADFIEGKLNLQAYKVRGVIDTLGASSFTIGDLTVAYTPAVVDSGLVLSEGLFVEVKSRPPNFDMASLTLTATQVESDAIDAPDQAELEVEGFVTSTSMTPFAAGGSFNIGAQVVDTSGATQFLGGLAEDLVVGVKVEAEGQSLDNRIQAEKVKFKDSVRLEGNLVATGDSAIFTLEGLSSIEVEVGEFTRVDDSVTPVEGDHVRVRGREVDSGSASTRRVLAGRIRVRGPSDDRVEVQAVVEAEDEPPTPQSVTILGLVIDTSSFDDDAGDSDFEDENDTEISRAAFYAAVQAGTTVVKARGDLTREGLWREVELEGDDD